MIMRRSFCEINDFKEECLKCVLIIWATMCLKYDIKLNQILTIPVGN